MKKYFFIFYIFLNFFGLAQTEKDSIFVAYDNNDITLYKNISNLGVYTRLENPIEIKPENKYSILIYDIKKSSKDISYQDSYYIYAVYGNTPVYFRLKYMNVYKEDNSDYFKLIDLFNFFETAPPEYKNMVKNLAFDLSKYQREREINKVLDYFNSFKNKKIGVITARPFENYSFTGAKFKIINFSPKTIKYITFKYHGLNAVDDKVYLGKNMLTVTSKGIGPVEYLETGSWEFEYAWSTDIVETMVLKTMEIIYMDGSKAIINMNDNLYFEEEYIDKLSKLAEES